jgi:hypothetical protein
MKFLYAIAIFVAAVSAVAVPDPNGKQCDRKAEEKCIRGCHNCCGLEAGANGRA